MLGACTSALAGRALDAADGRIGALVPCTVVVRQEEPGGQTVSHVGIMRTARLVGLAPDGDGIAAISAETGGMADEAFGNRDAAE